MSKLISKGNLPSVIHLPTSKSYANRALILASLKPQNVTIENISEAEDVKFLISCLNKIGVTTVVNGTSVEITNQFPLCEEQLEVTLEVGEGGTTARFLACMLLLGKSKYHLLLGKRLKNRPWEEFISIANSLGAHVSLIDDKLTIQGPINIPERLEVDCSETTQFASGFQMALSFKRTQVVPQNLKTSQSYLKMTQDMIDSLKNGRIYSVPLDWSSASYPMAFAALKHEIYFPKLQIDPLQADAKFLDLLKIFDCIEEDLSGIRVRKIEDPYKDILWDASDSLDLVPTLAFFLSHIEGTHRILNVHNLIHKESNRLNEVIDVLRKFGFASKYENDELVIEGTSLVQSLNVKLELPEDHRMVMMASLFMRFHEGGEVSPEDAVKKSYPNFFDLLK